MLSFAVLPAAGRSRRMGRPKLLLPWGEETLFRHVLSVWQSSRVQHVVVVAHPDDRQVAELARQAGVDVVVPQQPPAEMKHSVRLGLQFIAKRYRPDESAVWLLAPADMPDIQSATIDLVLEQHVPECPAIVVPTYAGRRGHPVLFPWKLHEAVHELARHETIKSLLARRPVREFTCPSADVLADVDTPADYQQRHQAWLDRAHEAG